MSKDKFKKFIGNTSSNPFLPKIILIPTPIAENGIADIPSSVLSAIKPLKYFIVEDLRSARRALRKMGYQENFDTDVQFIVFDKENPSSNDPMIEQWIQNGYDIGVLSEAGQPCIADPGHYAVRRAHLSHYQIQPLSGPSSIMMALVASGLQGQQFSFHGYLPIDKSERIKKIKFLENRMKQESQTQIFMEAPYRNQALLKDLIEHLQNTTILSVSCHISEEDAYIRSLPTALWKDIKELPNLHKKPTIFIIGN